MTHLPLEPVALPEPVTARPLVPALRVWEGNRPARDPAATHILMCEPTAYALKYEINPWMSLGNSPDVALAARQWRELYRVLTEEVGANVSLVPQSPDCPDMVFTANAGRCPS